MCARSARPWTVASLAAGVCFTTSLALAWDANLRSRVLTDAPRAWSKIADLSSHFEAKYSDTIVPPKEPETRREWHLKFSGRDEWMVMRTAYPADGSSGVDEVYCRNSRYSFHLRRSSPQRPWVVMYVGKEPDIPPQNLGVAKLAKEQLYLGPEYLPDLVRTPSFSINEVKTVDRASGQLVSVEFSCSDSNNSWGDVARSGVFLLSPKRLWAVEEFKVDFADRDGQVNRVSQTNDFQDAPDDVPILSKWQETISNAPNERPGKRSWVVNEWKYRDIPEEEFTLAAFGLPEIAAPSTWASARLWLTLTAAGIVCILIALLIRRRARATQQPAGSGNEECRVVRNWARTCPVFEG